LPMEVETNLPLLQSNNSWSGQILANGDARATSTSLVVVSLMKRHQFANQVLHLRHVAFQCGMHNYVDR